MEEKDISILVEEGVEAVDRGDTVFGLLQLEKAAGAHSNPLVFSYLAYCLARERRMFSDAFALCREALEREPTSPSHYLNLGRIYLCAGEKNKAIKAFRRGLRYRRHHPLIVRELDRLGVRRRPFLPFLERDNPINRYTGKLLARLGLH